LSVIFVQNAIWIYGNQSFDHTKEVTIFLSRALNRPTKKDLEKKKEKRLSYRETMMESSIPFPVKKEK